VENLKITLAGHGDLGGVAAHPKLTYLRETKLLALLVFGEPWSARVALSGSARRRSASAWRVTRRSPSAGAWRARSAQQTLPEGG
jgi:hypothetical protein